MTTVVCNRDEMASDSQATGVAKVAVPKIFVIDRHIIGTSGNASEVADLVNILRELVREKATFTEALRAVSKVKGNELLILCPDGKIKFFEGGGAYSVRQPYAASGSGELGALCLISEGYTPTEVIRVVKRHDPWTGGRIQVKRRADVI